MSPTARALQQLRKDGWLAEVVERFIPGARVRRDLFQGPRPMTPPDLDRLAARFPRREHHKDHLPEDCDRCAFHALLAHVRAVEQDNTRLRLKVEQYQRQLDDRWAGVVGVTNEAVAKLAQMKLDLDIAQGAHEHDCGIFQERWCTCRVAGSVECPRQNECRDVRRAHDDLAAKMVTILGNLQPAPVEMCVCDHEWYAHFDHRPFGCKRCGCANPTLRAARATRTDGMVLTDLGKDVNDVKWVDVCILRGSCRHQPPCKLSGGK